jgi:hypothetical protein
MCQFVPTQSLFLYAPKTDEMIMITLFLNTWGVKNRIFDASDHLCEWNARKDHLRNFLSKRTPCGWRHVWSGDTWHVPLEPTPAWGCRHPQVRHVDRQWRWWAMPPLAVAAGWRGACHAAFGSGGRMTWRMPCRLWQWRQDDVAHGRRWQQMCRRWLWRHPHVGVGPGGTCHVSPGQTCRHP